MLGIKLARTVGSRGVSGLGGFADETSQGSQIVSDIGQEDRGLAVPPNTTVTVYLPMQKEGKMMMNRQVITGSVHEVEAGEYRFVVG